MKEFENFKIDEDYLPKFVVGSKIKLPIGTWTIKAIDYLDCPVDKTRLKEYR